MIITTPCIVDAANAIAKGSEFLASRGLDWPLAEVAGRKVHKCCVSDAEHAVRAAADGTLVVGADGVGRWSTNGRVIFDDMAALFIALGLGEGLDLAATREAHDTETRQFIEQYRASQPAEASPEELAEMRAAFGPGETVIDVISGRVTQL